MHTILSAIKRNRKGILLMLISSLCVCVGQLLWKMSASGSLLFLLVGFALYGLGALAMLISYRYGKLSVLQPMLSLNYVISIFLAVVVLKEPVSLANCAGVILIIGGVIMIAWGDEE